MTTIAEHERDFNLGPKAESKLDFADVPPYKKLCSRQWIWVNVHFPAPLWECLLRLAKVVNIHLQIQTEVLSSNHIWDQIWDQFEIKLTSGYTEKPKTTFKMLYKTLGGPPERYTAFAQLRSSSKGKGSRALLWSGACGGPELINRKLNPWLWGPLNLLRARKFCY